MEGPPHECEFALSTQSLQGFGLADDGVGQVMAVPGIETASVVMASATNVENLAYAGLGTFEVRPNDLVVAVSGTDEACAEALATGRRAAQGERRRRRR